MTIFTRGRNLVLASLSVLVLGAIFRLPLQELQQLFFPTLAKVYDPRPNVTYQGVLESGVEHYHNIFYAQDTSGPRRFAPPVKFIPGPGSIIDAAKPGAMCPQGMGDAPLPFTSPVTNVSENCLSLQIARPAGTKSSAKLPVVVWLHGGGAILGASTDQLYKPDGLVKQSVKNRQPIIFVGVNYRLGIFGFAASTALENAGHMNAGLRDQRAAFEWVRDHISAFGGDPGQVTAIGQSVGGAHIGLHLTSYRGEKGVPFQNAIMMSGASGLNFNIKSGLVARNTAAVAKQLNCVKADAGSDATLQCLRDIPLQPLMNASVGLARQLHPPFGELSFYPAYDGDYIPERPSVLLRNGEFVKDIPLIASWVNNDGAWYALPTTPDDDAVLASFKAYVVGLSQKSLDRFLQLYPLSDFRHLETTEPPVTAQYYRAAQINRDLFFTCPVIDFTWQYVKHGSANVRLYEMNQTRFDPVFKMIGVPHWRVSHLSDIPYVMNNLVAAGGDNSPEQLKLASLVSGSVAAFAHTGDPTKSRGQAAMSDWPEAYSVLRDQGLNEEHPAGLTVQVIGGEFGTGPATVVRSGKADSSAKELALEREKLFERCEFINSIQEEIGV